MTLTITIEMDNAAFERGNRRHEVQRILHEQIVMHPKAGGCSLFTAGDGKLRDINGNTCGSWAVSE